MGKQGNTIMATPSSSTCCRGCSASFPTRNAIFRHLRDTDGACLSPSDYQDFVENVKSKVHLQKSLVLYGYLPSIFSSSGEEKSNGTRHESSPSFRNGDDAARLLLEVLGCANQKVNRSYGNRATDALQQDACTGAVSEVLSVRLAPMPKHVETAVVDWKKGVNGALEERLSGSTAQIRVLGRLDLPNANRFNAEMDLKLRRVEYLLPADFFMDKNEFPSRDEFFRQLPSFSADTHTASMDQGDDANKPMLKFSLRMKKTMQLLTTDSAENRDKANLQMEQSFHEGRRKRRNKPKDKRRKEMTNDCKDESKRSTSSETEGSGGGDTVSQKANGSPTTGKRGKNVLQRRRFHNFTPRVMAHEFLAFRRLTRFYHRATIPYNDDDRPFLVLSLTGDLFLQGQVHRLVGLLVALMRGLVPPDMVDCIMDERYPDLVPTPPAPVFGMYAAEAAYPSWEGKAQLILTPRASDRYPGGWNNEETLAAVREWHTIVQARAVDAWCKDGVTLEGRLVAEEEWTRDVLEPWADSALEQLNCYRQWKQKPQQNVQYRLERTTTTPIESPLSSVDTTVPALFQTVLHQLRQINSSGQWPGTTAKRRLVMVDTNNTPNNLKDTRAAKEDDTKKGNLNAVYTNDGASGSFSVGAMPGDSPQPRANTLFPELVKAAFELERALCPHRESSSTIAVNRNAQFRPHTDSGTGAGQSTSLIVGLGTYTGGGLVVEGAKHDIRYRALEFNGWKERHWTMPFEGERFSLVWFTPIGCEGVHGIDLYGT